MGRAGGDDTGCAVRDRERKPSPAGDAVSTALVGSNGNEVFSMRHTRPGKTYLNVAIRPDAAPAIGPAPEGM
jgi:hypothetical protein